MISDGPVQIVFIILNPFTRTTIKVTVRQESFLQRRRLDLLRLGFWTKIIWIYKRKNTQIIKSISNMSSASVKPEEQTKQHIMIQDFIRHIHNYTEYNQQ